uniref:Uncharacterized protein n=1 Tax=Anguilla anguilla TaxID=7936 RepID=A0A0E9PMC2_ANGAN
MHTREKLTIYIHKMNDMNCVKHKKTADKSILQKNQYSCSVLRKRKSYLLLYFVIVGTNPFHLKTQN